MTRSHKRNIRYLLSWLVRLPGFWICALAFILLFTLLSKQEFWSGYDTYFHMNSIYEDAMQIRTGHYSYFISLFGFERSGRIVNSLYSPVFNYLLGAILLLCGSWIRFEFVIFFITLVISGLSIYACSRELQTSKLLAMLLGLFYMISIPVLYLWVRNFEFTGLGAAILLPFVIMVGIKILQQRSINVLLLAIIMAICLQIHLMTSLIATLSLIPFMGCGLLFASHKFKMIKKIFLAVGLSICLSGNIFGAIYDLYSTNHLIPTFPNFRLQVANNKALFVSNDYIVGLGHLYTLLLIIVILLIMVRFRDVTVIDCCLLFDDIVFLWLSSIYFPWDQLLKICPELASIVQFPVRFMSISFITTLLLLGRLITNLPIRVKSLVSVGLIILFGLALHSQFSTVHELSQAWQSRDVVRYWVRTSKSSGFSHNFHRGSRIRRALRSHNLSRGVNVVHKVTSDYLPTYGQLNIYNYYHWPTNQTYIRDFRNQKDFHKYTRNHELLMNWRSSSGKTVNVPLVKYGNTVAMLNHHQIHSHTSLVGTMNIHPRRGLNHISIRYQPSRVFKIMSIISICSWSLVMISVGINIIKRKTN